MMKFAPIAPAIALAVFIPKVKADAYSDLVISEHNAARERFGAPPLTWSEDLVHAAQSYANQCNFVHDETRGDVSVHTASSQIQQSKTTNFVHLALSNSPPIYRILART